MFLDKSYDSVNESEEKPSPANEEGAGRNRFANSSGTFECPEVMQDDFDDMDTPENPNRLLQCLGYVSKGVKNFYQEKNQFFIIAFNLIFLCLYATYFAFAMKYEKLKTEASIRLLVVTCLVTLFIIIYLIRKAWGERISSFLNQSIFRPLSEYNEEHSNVPKKAAVIIFSLLVVTGVVVIIIFMVATKTPYNLMSLAGILCLLTFSFCSSVHPNRVKWRTVLVGFLLQFIFALFILKTDAGFKVFKFLGERVAEFMQHANYGKAFLFDRNPQVLLGFAFNVLPIIIFFSSITSVLFYLGLMQMVIEKVSWIMQVTMGTTAAESLNAAGNIFIGMTEAPLMIRPFIGRMTNSELHAVMTGGFATVSGSVMGAYISLGVPANHLISASVMSAPAALAVSKIFYPETKKSLTTGYHVKQMGKSHHKNLVDAAAGGVIICVTQVAYIAALLIAFLSLLDFVNTTLAWCGYRAGMIHPLTFEYMCSFVLWPLSFIMGVDSRDCWKVSELIGIKTFINEFAAYAHLGKTIENSVEYASLTKTAGMALTVYRSGSDLVLKELNRTMKYGFFYEERSQVIATYSLCGFSNFGSVGIMIGALAVMAPKRQTDISSIAVRAMFAGNVSCFLTACIAGLFFEPKKK